MSSQGYSRQYEGTLAYKQKIKVKADFIGSNGDLVALNSGGYLEVADGTNTFIGTLGEKVDNTNGANGAKSALVNISGRVWLPFSGASITNLLKPFYITGENTISQGFNPSTNKSDGQCMNYRTNEVLIAFENSASEPGGGAMDYKGTWDADTNDPELSDSGGGGVKGDFYIVSVAGSTSIDGISDWKIGDWIVNNGSQWNKIDNTEPTVDPRRTAMTLSEVVNMLNSDTKGLVNDGSDNFTWTLGTDKNITIDANGFTEETAVLKFKDFENNDIILIDSSGQWKYGINTNREIFTSINFNAENLSTGNSHQIRAIVERDEYGNGWNIQFGTGTGTKIGTSANQKIALWNATPVVQPSHIADASTSHATTSFAEVNTALDNIGTLINSILANVFEAVGLTASA